MKYIKSFENISLDNDDKEILMQHALDKNKKKLIKSLLDDGYDPNSKIDYVHLLNYYSNNINKDTFDVNIFNMIVDSGVDKTKFNDLFFEAIYLYNRKFTNTVQYVNLLKRFIELGVDLLNHKDDYGGCALELIFEKIEDVYPKKLSQDIINMIKKEAPEQYDKYIYHLEMLKNTDKYNL